MSIKKEYFKTKPTCKVTFKLPEKIAQYASKASLVGEFNDWDLRGIPMKKLKNGEFKASLQLEKNKEYQFKYLVNEETWENENEADKYVPNAFQGENSVIVV